MCCDDSATTGVYFGTRSGDVFGSRDEGRSWSRLAGNLPDVLCLRSFAVDTPQAVETADSSSGQR